MRVWTDESAFDLPACACALGTFDGLHLGHRALLRRTCELAKEEGLASVVYTFDRHPLALLCPERAPKELLPLPEKLERLEALGVDGVLLRPFTPAFAALSPLAFLELLVQKLRARVLVAGFNYRFGADGAGDADLLREVAPRLGCRAEIVPAVRDGGDIVSSTLIRSLLANGDMERARRLLCCDEPPKPPLAGEDVSGFATDR